MMSSFFAGPLTTIGKILAPFGVKGALKVYPYSDFLERCTLLREVMVERKGIHEHHRVTEARVHKNIWVIKLEDTNSREEAAMLTGSLIKIPARERLALPEGSYYFDEIIGLTALSVTGEKLGTVREIIKAGANDVYVVEQEKGLTATGRSREILVPATRNVVKEINLQKGYMLLDLPPGLID